MAAQRYNHRVRAADFRLKKVSGGQRTSIKTLATRGHTFSATKGEPFLHIEFTNSEGVPTHSAEIPIAAIPESVVQEWMEIEEGS